MVHYKDQKRMRKVHCKFESQLNNNNVRWKVSVWLILHGVGASLGGTVTNGATPPSLFKRIMLPCKTSQHIVFYQRIKTR